MERLGLIDGVAICEGGHPVSRKGERAQIILSPSRTLSPFESNSVLKPSSPLNRCIHYVS